MDRNSPGTVFFDDLEIAADPAAATPATCSSAFWIRRSNRRCRVARARRTRASFGRVLIVGGGVGMPGAVRLAGEACLRVGAGLVTVAVAPENVPAIAAGRPELICLPLAERRGADGDVRADRRDRHRPGTRAARRGREACSIQCCDAASRWSSMRTRSTSLRSPASPAREDWILTPHPGEACAPARHRYG